MYGERDRCTHTHAHTHTFVYILKMYTQIPKSESPQREPQKNIQNNEEKK